MFLSCFVHLPALSEDSRTGNVRTGRLRVQSDNAFVIYMNGEQVAAPEKEIRLSSGINRLIAIVQGGREDFAFGMVFLNSDGTYMNDLEYRLTMDEVEPK
ncbi:hypothetical protein [Paenibacillus sonchi]|uniref:hypothetical protein n=1 Tax=Paenibacillus sonchi TaxID=373687 RepID=UPI001F29FEF7|nr:hypothetical protein [Paenibacillus sonchi]